MPIGTTNEHSKRLAERLASPYSCTSAGSQNKSKPSLNSSSGNRLYSGSDSKSIDNVSSISIGTSTADFWNGNSSGSNSGTPK
jgi:hypothetical protein